MEFLLVTLCFLFGFVIGAVVLKSIPSKKEKKLELEKVELISRIEKLNKDIIYLKGRLSFYQCHFAMDVREFKIIENFESFDIVLRLVGIIPYKEESILIKRFYFRNDIEYAKLCAQELLDELNNTN